MKHGEYYLCDTHKNPLCPRYMKDIKLLTDYNVWYYGNTPVVTSAGPCTHYIYYIENIQMKRISCCTVALITY